MSGGHFESLTAVNIHEVQNIIVSLLSFLRKKKSVPIRDESHNAGFSDVNLPNVCVF